jgi:hypothetical protein
MEVRRWLTPEIPREWPMGEARRRKLADSQTPDDPLDAAPPVDNPEGMRTLIAKYQRGETLTPDQVFDLCPFRTVIGPCPPGMTRAAFIRYFNEHPGGMVALIEDAPSPFSPEQTAEMVETLASGRPIMLVATHRAVRDHAKAMIMALLAAPKGNA